jgi:hypothetical protein
LDDDGDNSGGERDVEKYYDNMIEMKKTLFRKAHKNIKGAQARYKRDFDKKHQRIKV